MRIALPERGDKRRLLRVVTTNAKEAFLRHKLKRASDFAARSRALAELGEALGRAQPPLRIEAYDVSNIGPTATVGSMVVFEDGLPKRADYRRFEIKGVPGQDDFASMEEMLRRRFARYLKDRDEPVEHRRRFSYPPALVVVDGGRGQLNVAIRVLSDLGLDIPAIGPARKKALLRRFGSLARLAAASEGDIATTPGIGPTLAREIGTMLRSRQAMPRR